MKRSTLIAIGFVSLAGIFSGAHLASSAVAADTTQPSVPPAAGAGEAAAWNQLVVAVQSMSKSRLMGGGPRPTTQAIRKMAADIPIIANQYLHDYPDGPHHWNALWVLISRFSFPGDDGPVKVDAASRYDDPRLAEWVEKIVASTDAPDNFRRSAMAWQLTAIPDFRDLTGQTKREAENNQESYTPMAILNLVPVRQKLQALIDRYPDDQQTLRMLTTYVNGLRSHTPMPDAEANIAWLRQLSSDQSHKQEAEFAQSALVPVEAMSTPMHIAFTALDGRAVDLAKLNGKVVLVDFWATWCGPCKDELPNVKAAYQKFHDQGFEVIGVSLDNDKSKQTVIDYCHDQGLPWPEYFDGKQWENELAVRCAVRSIPQAWLFDKNGLLVTTSAHGEELQKLVAEQLAKPAAAH